MDMSVFTVNVLPTLIDTLKTGTDDAKDDALGQLAQIMDTSYGEDAEAPAARVGDVALGNNIVNSCKNNATNFTVTSYLGGTTPDGSEALSLRSWSVSVSRQSCGQEHRAPCKRPYAGEKGR